MTYTRVMPDFEEWAKHILDRDELETALKQAYEQGYNAGSLDEKETGWVKE